MLLQAGGELHLGLGLGSWDSESLGQGLGQSHDLLLAYLCVWNQCPLQGTWAADLGTALGPSPALSVSWDPARVLSLIHLFYSQIPLPGSPQAHRS